MKRQSAAFVGDDTKKTMDKLSAECKTFFFRCLRESNNTPNLQVDDARRNPGCWQDWYYTCLNPPAVVPLGLIVALLVLAYFSALGNSIACIVFGLYNQLRLVKHFFVINLSVADIIIVTISVPLYAAFNLGIGPGNWTGNKTLCQSHLVLDIMCGTASILSLAVISVERYVAVVYPLHYNGSVTPSRAKYALGGIWAYSVLVSSIILLSFVAPGEDNLRDRCLFIGREYATFISLASFILPLGVMVAAYSIIFMVALGQARRIDSMSPGQVLPEEGAESTQRRSRATQSGSTKLKRELKAAKTVTIIMGTHILCWCPLFVFLLVHSYCPSCRNSSSMEIVLYVSLVLRYLNTLANPVIYSGINRQFREAVLKFLCRKSVTERDLLATRNVSLSQCNNNTTERVTYSPSSKV